MDLLLGASMQGGGLRIAEPVPFTDRRPLLLTDAHVGIPQLGQWPLLAHHPHDFSAGQAQANQFGLNLRGCVGLGISLG